MRGGEGRGKEEGGEVLGDGKGGKGKEGEKKGERGRQGRGE